MNLLRFAAAVALLGCNFNAGAESATPVWIEPEFASESFDLPPGVQSVRLRVAVEFCSIVVRINDNRVLSVEGYCPTQDVDVTAAVRQGINKLSIVRTEYQNSNVPTKIAFEITYFIAGRPHTVLTSTADSADIKVINRPGYSPLAIKLPKSSASRIRPELWGIGRRDASISPLENYEQWQQSKTAGSEPTQKFYVPEGFEVSLLRKAAADEGSWISLGFDAQGRALVSREDQGFLRLSFDAGHQKVERVEPIASDLKECRGLLYAYDRWYANANNSKGMYRFQIDEAGKIVDQKLLREFPGGVGHGRNDLALGKDGRIYSIHGDSVETPTTDVVDRTSPLDRQRPGAKPNRGYVVSTDAEDGAWEVLCTGLRNPYGLGVHPSGDLFTYDADNEFDMGTPWYRPTRIVHLRSGADYGYRITADNRRPNYVDRCDNAQPLIDVGRGSPTACMFGTDLKFPQPYRDALYVLDWTYGRVLAVHMAPRGGGYRANLETFLQGRPLNVTDVAAGPDGAMYLVTGGRKTQSALYRVAFAGRRPPTEVESPYETRAAEYAEQNRLLREHFESLHGREYSGAVGVAESKYAVSQARKYLDHADPTVRYAARTVIEQQPPERWMFDPLPAHDPNLEHLISLAHLGTREGCAAIVAKLLAPPTADASRSPNSPNLRAAFNRVYLYDRIHAKHPELLADHYQAIIAQLTPLWPDLAREGLVVSQYGNSHDLRRRLIVLLGKLNAPQAVDLAAKDLLTSTVQEDKLAALSALSTIKTGWTPETRRRYFTALRDARRFVGGQGMPGFLDQIKSDAVATLSDAEKQQLADLLAPPKEVDEPLPPTRPIVKKWTLDELAKLTAAGDSDDPTLRGDATKGAVVFRDALCSRCHRAGLSGPAVGPDLTFVAARFSRRDILHSVLEPSAAVAEQYRNTEIVTDDGRTLVGRVVSEGDFRSEKLLINTDPLRPSRVTEVDKKQIAEHRSLGTSPMPQGLLDGFTAAEVIDLLAFLERGP
jgi:putative heme-binding domain-containing protein